jgi:hypothetical protein
MIKNIMIQIYWLKIFGISFVMQTVIMFIIGFAG